ncbi:hypothetical protein KUCAC02_025629, partial [Chaenocephalus aceratus]
APDPCFTLEALQEGGGGLDRTRAGPCLQALSSVMLLYFAKPCEKEVRRGKGKDEASDKCMLVLREKHYIILLLPGKVSRSAMRSEPLVIPGAEHTAAEPLKDPLPTVRKTFETLCVCSPHNSKKHLSSGSST